MRSGGLMRLSILLLVFWGSTQAQAFSITHLVGHYEAPSGCTVSIQQWAELESGQVAVVFREARGEYPTAFVLDETNLLSPYELGFENARAGASTGFYDYKVNFKLLLNDKSLPVQLTYEIWEEFKGFKIPNSKEIFVCSHLNSTKIID